MSAPTPAPATVPAPTPAASTSATPTVNPPAAATPAAPTPASNGGTKKSSNNPLEGLSQAELRKKLEASRKDLRGYLERKKKVDRELAGLEASIYAFEGSYLSDALIPSTGQASATAQFGNIIKGYDAYLKAPPTGNDRKRARANDEPRAADRMFSMSSATYQKAVEMRTAENGAESASEEEASSSNGKKKKRH